MRRHFCEQILKERQDSHFDDQLVKRRCILALEEFPEKSNLETAVERMVRKLSNRMLAKVCSEKNIKNLKRLSLEVAGEAACFKIKNFQILSS